MNMNADLQAQQPETHVSENAYFHTMQVAVLYPLLQSLITGVIIGLAVVAFAWYVSWPKPWSLGLLIASLTQCAAWLISLARWHRWVYKLEDLTGWDLNRDGQIGNRPDPIRVEVIQQEGRQVDFIDLPASQEQLISLASGLMIGAPFAETHWTGERAPFSKGEFHQVRDTMIRRGLARWVNPRAHAQGMELTAPGRAVMRRFASMAGRPPTLSKPQDAN